MTRNDLILCVVAAACVAMSYIATDIYLPAMPVIRSFFSVDTVAVQATVSIYLIGIILGQLALGPVADHLGFKQIAIPLSCILIAGSLVCASAHVIIILYIGRFIQAIAAGGLAVIGRASFSRHFPAEQAASLYITIIPLIAVSSPAFAPILGGILTHYINWQSIFWTLALMSAIILWGLIYKYPIGKLADAQTSLNPIFIFKTYSSLLRHKTFASYLIIISFAFAIYYAYITEAPFIFYSQGYSVKEIGFSFISIAIAFLIAAQIGRKLLKRFSVKTVLNIGFILILAGLVILFFIGLLKNPPMPLVLIPATLYTGSIGIVNPIAMSKGIALFPKTTGYASSLIGASSLLGAAIGAQFVDIITHGSIQILALSSFIVILFAWFFYTGLARNSN